MGALELLLADEIRALELLHAVLIGALELLQPASISATPVCVVFSGSLSDGAPIESVEAMVAPETTTAVVGVPIAPVLAMLDGSMKSAMVTPRRSCWRRSTTAR